MLSAASGASSTSGRERPRFRQDLIAETVELQGARFIDVAAPEGGDVFRFYEVEYSLACGMDGERDVAGIVKWAQDELGLTPSHQEVRIVIATLTDLGFIEPPTELAVGVVTAPPDRAQPSASVELGAAGGGGSRPAPLPPAPDLALGAAGAAARAARPTPSPPGGVVLGAPGARSQRPTPSAPHSTSDVSLDLSEHISVRPDDVKEAVRASKVMAAVDVPVDVMEVIQDRPTAPASAFDAPTVARIPEVEALAETTRSPDLGRGRAFDPTERADIRVGKSPPGRQPSASKPPVELPPPPAQTERVRPPPAQRAGVSPVLIVALVLLVLTAIVLLAWKYMLDKPAPDADTTAVAPPAFKPPPPPPPPPAPTAQIVLETPDPDEVKVTRSGVVETVLADQARVKEGDIVLRLVGDKPIEAELANLTRDLKKLKDQIENAAKRRDNAHNAGNKGQEAAAQNEITDRERSLSNKQNLIATKTADLDGFLVHAAAAGTFSPQVKLGQKLTVDAVIGKLQRDPIPTATFKVANTSSYAANASVEVTVGKGGEQRVTCTVADVQPDSVKLNCPGDAALNQGTDVALQTPTATAPTVPEPPPPPSPPTPGSGAPSENPAPSPPATGQPPGEPAGSAAPAAPAPSAPAAPAPEAPPMPGSGAPPAGSAAEPAGSAAPAAPAPAAPPSGSAARGAG